MATRPDNTVRVVIEADAAFDRLVVFGFLSGGEVDARVRVSVYVDLVVGELAQLLLHRDDCDRPEVVTDVTDCWD